MIFKFKFGETFLELTEQKYASRFIPLIFINQIIIKVNIVNLAFKTKNNSEQSKILQISNIK